MDETDTVTDNRSRRIAKRQGTAAVMREYRIDRTLIIEFSLTLRDLRRRHYRETQEKRKLMKIKVQVGIKRSSSDRLPPPLKSKSRWKIIRHIKRSDG